MAMPKEFVNADGLEHLLEKLVTKIKSSPSTSGFASEIMILLAQIMAGQRMIDSMQNTKILILAKELRRLQRRVAKCCGANGGGGDTVIIPDDDDDDDTPPKLPDNGNNNNNPTHPPNCTCSTCCQPMSLDTISDIFTRVVDRLNKEEGDD
jgi:hypothetical protein